MVAIFTLAGVIVGGLLSGAVQLYLKRRDEERSRLIAARLVLDELTWVAAALKTVLNGSDLDVRAALSTRELDDLWKEQRVILAGEMDDASWTHVYQAIEFTRVQANTLDSPGRESLENWYETLVLALVDLRLVATTKSTATTTDSRANEREALRNALHNLPSDKGSKASG